MDAFRFSPHCANIAVDLADYYVNDAKDAYLRIFTPDAAEVQLVREQCTKRLPVALQQEVSEAVPSGSQLAVFSTTDDLAFRFSAYLALINSPKFIALDATKKPFVCLLTRSKASPQETFLYLVSQDEMIIAQTVTPVTPPGAGIYVPFAYKPYYAGPMSLCLSSLRITLQFVDVLFETGPSIDTVLLWVPSTSDAQLSSAYPEGVLPGGRHYKLWKPSGSLCRYLGVSRDKLRLDSEQYLQRCMQAVHAAQSDSSAKLDGFSYIGAAFSDRSAVWRTLFQHRTDGAVLKRLALPLANGKDEAVLYQRHLDAVARPPPPTDAGQLLLKASVLMTSIGGAENCALLVPAMGIASIAVQVSHEWECGKWRKQSIFFDGDLPEYRYLDFYGIDKRSKADTARVMPWLRFMTATPFVDATPVGVCLKPLGVGGEDYADLWFHDKPADRFVILSFSLCNGAYTLNSRSHTAPDGVTILSEPKNDKPVPVAPTADEDKGWEQVSTNSSEDSVGVQPAPASVSGSAPPTPSRPAIGAIYLHVLSNRLVKVMGYLEPLQEQTEPMLAVEAVFAEPFPVTIVPSSSLGKHVPSKPSQLISDHDDRPIYDKDRRRRELHSLSAIFAGLAKPDGVPKTAFDALVKAANGRLHYVAASQTKVLTGWVSVTTYEYTYEAGGWYFVYHFANVGQTGEFMKNLDQVVLDLLTTL